MEGPQDPVQRVLGCGCLGVLLLFGIAATVAVVLWSASMLGHL